MLERKIKVPIWGDQRECIHENIKGYIEGYREGKAIFNKALWKQHFIENVAYFSELGRCKNRVLCVYDGTPQDQFIFQSYIPSLSKIKSTNQLDKNVLKEVDLVLIFNPSGRKGLLFKKWAEELNVPTFGFLKSKDNPEDWTRFVLVSRNNLMEEMGPFNHFILAYIKGYIKNDL